MQDLLEGLGKLLQDFSIRRAIGLLLPILLVYLGVVVYERATNTLALARLELERLAAAGVPLPRLMEGATIEAARVFHLDSLYGTVEAGKVANLVLLRANPLETVRAYDAIDLVVVRGKVVDRSALAAR